MRFPVFAIAVEAQEGRWRSRLSGLLAMARGLVTARMSPVLFCLDFVVYPVLVIVCLVVAFSGEGGVLLAVSTAVLGIALWTFTEYVAHRCVLHHVPGFAKLHHAHHDAPKDLVGTPTLISVALFLVLAFWPALEVSNLQIAAALMAGLWSGYLAYTVAHYAIHHTGSNRYGVFRTLKRHHALHHFRNGQSNFGVTTTVWDRVFRTLAV